MAELKHLRSAWDVDRHIVLDSAEKLVLVRFSGYENPPAEVLYAVDTDYSSPIVNGNRKRLRNGVENIVGGGSVDHEDHGKVEESHSKVSSSGAQSAGAVVAGQEHYLQTQQMDALLVQLAPKVRKYCTIYAVDTNEVPEFDAMYELGHDRDPFAVMFFFRGQHIRVDVGTGNNNKINFFAFEDWEGDFLPILNAAYRAGKLGKNMASSEKKFTTVSVRR